jgi:glutamyl-tRNA synthetase
MLAVVVDDQDMGVNLIIRGDDHFTNTFRQMQIYKALSWDIPRYAHIPLIHSQEGQKLSKRNCAVGVEQYREAGYLAEALCNYLLRLGWGGDGTQEIISMQEAIQIFDIHDVSKAPARFDQNKLNYINSLYINGISDVNLANFVIEKLNIANKSLQERVRDGIFYLKERAKTLNELAEMATIYLYPKQSPDARSQEILEAEEKRDWQELRVLSAALAELGRWDFESLQGLVKASAERLSCKEARILQLLRASVVRTFTSPGICEVMVVLGKEETLLRINQLVMHK